MYHSREPSSSSSSSVRSGPSAQTWASARASPQSVASSWNGDHGYATPHYTPSNGASTPTRGVQIPAVSSSSSSRSMRSYSAVGHLGAPGPRRSSTLAGRRSASSSDAASLRSVPALGKPLPTVSAGIMNSRRQAAYDHDHSTQHDASLYSRPIRPSLSVIQPRLDSSRSYRSSFDNESFVSAPSVLERMHTRGFTDVPSTRLASTWDSIDVHNKKGSIDSGYRSNVSYCGSDVATPSVEGSRSDSTQTQQGSWGTAIKRVVGWESERDNSAVLASYDEIPLPALPRAPPSAHGTGLWNRITTNIKMPFFLVDSDELDGNDDAKLGPDGETKLARAIKEYHFTKAETVDDLPTWLIDEDELRRRQERRYSVVPTRSTRYEESPLPQTPMKSGAPIERRSATGLRGLGLANSAQHEFRDNEMLSGGRSARPEMPASCGSSRSIEKLKAMREQERLRR